MLKETFKGLAYDKDQPEIANMARMLHFQQHIVWFQENQDFASIIAWTYPLTNDKGQTLINKTYQFPPHLVWQIISARLFAYTQSEKLLIHFESKFNRYTQYIWDSARRIKKKSSKTWKKGWNLHISNVLLLPINPVQRKRSAGIYP